MESIIALHGLGGTKEVYLEVQNELASFNITAIDLPGHGKQPTLEYFTKESLIEWLTKYVKEPTIFIGYSISCRILIDFAYTYPHLVEKLIYINKKEVALYIRATSFLLDISFKRKRWIK